MKKFSRRKNGFYTIEGNQYPSVTKILQAIAKPALIYWACIQGWEISKKEKIETSVQLLKFLKKIQNENMARGSDTHAWIEEYFKTGKMPEKENEFVAGFKLFLKEHIIKEKYIEQEIYSKNFNYAGTCDFVGFLDGEKVVVDFKTNKEGRIYPEVELQLTAYSIALNEMGLTKDILPMAVIVITPDSYKIQKFKPNKLSEFLAVYKIWQWLNPKIT